MKCASVVMMWGLALYGAGSTASSATLQFERDLKQTEVGASFVARVTLDAAATTQLCVSLTSSNPALVAWASEAAEYDYSGNQCSGVCGHYTQVVWLSTLEVGCGFAVCPKLQYSANLVCNYGPGGNASGQRPY